MIPFGSIIFLSRGYKRPGRAVLLAHIAGELQPYPVMLVDHAVIFDDGLHGCMPDPVVQPQRLFGVRPAALR